ncbi:MAG: chorismate mutase [Clostridia bacterium]|nr:chorismate mutase [Clostridia bacterium]
MDIKDARQKIDEIDAQLIKLFTERMNTSAAIAEYKRENNKPVFDPARERDIINKITSETDPELESYAKTLYLTMFDLSRSYQKKLLRGKSKLSERIEKVTAENPTEFPKRAIVACQGVEGAYSQQACEKLFEYPSIMYFNNFEGVFNAVERGLCRYGVLPLENSAAGSVNAVYDLMNKHQCYITAGLKLFIEHKLLAPEGTALSDIKEIFSHEQAINQCSDFLKSLPGVKVTVCENTAAAAKMVATGGRKDVAAIGSKECTVLYNLNVLETNIQNTENNYTRFICISKNLEIYPGASKTSIVMTLPHKPGALYNTIARFASLGLNLTKLESRPISGSNFEFMFYFDIDASVYSAELRALISELENDCEQFSYLGSYIEK